MLLCVMLVFVGFIFGFVVSLEFCFYDFTVCNVCVVGQRLIFELMFIKRKRKRKNNKNIFLIKFK